MGVISHLSIDSISVYKQVSACRNYIYTKTQSRTYCTQNSAWMLLSLIRVFLVFFRFCLSFLVLVRVFWIYRCIGFFGSNIWFCSQTSALLNFHGIRASLSNNALFFFFNPSLVFISSNGCWRTLHSSSLLQIRSCSYRGGSQIVQLLQGRQSDCLFVADKKHKSASKNELIKTTRNQNQMKPCTSHVHSKCVH